MMTLRKQLMAPVYFTFQDIDKPWINCFLHIQMLAEFFCLWSVKRYVTPCTANKLQKLECSPGQCKKIGGTIGKIKHYIYDVVCL